METLNCARDGCGQPRAEHSATHPHGIPALEPPLAGVTCEGYLAAIPCTNPEDTGGVTSNKELHDELPPHGRTETGCPEFMGDMTRGSFGGGGASGGW